MDLDLDLSLNQDLDLDQNQDQDQDRSPSLHGIWLQDQGNAGGSCTGHILR